MANQMKPLISIIVTLAVAGLRHQAEAFIAPKSGRASTLRLGETTLEDWQILDNGCVVGSVRDHPNLNDGDIITTSPLSSPGSVMVDGLVTTLSGSVYKLGKPMQLRSPNAVSNEVKDEVSSDNLLKVAGLVCIFAFGVAVGIGVSNAGLQ